MIKITINDEEKTFEETISIAEMLKSLGLDDKIMVVVLNEDIICQEDYGKTILKDGDRVELVRIVGGG
ncbi:MAG: sulfur carrier protein ThiS [Candidatus Hydrogenedentes bacterium]|nr:sulfur carrier protein ThiS [Candidatus Hydrogenedentota bacterium]